MHCADTEDTCVSLNWMIKRLVERVPSGVALIALDACRENDADSTFKSKGGPGVGQEAGARGFLSGFAVRD